MTAPLLRVERLSLTYPGASHAAPREVSFDINPGEVVLLLGPSGSGKSTLSLALNGLIPQAVAADIEGSVTIKERTTADTPVAELSTDVAMVFQDPDAQIVTGTLLDEVAFALENQLVPVDDVLTRSEAALRQVGLWERRAENPDKLSGGGRQRLAIACALAMGSPLIVLDEPTANLDPQGIDDVYAALADLVNSGDRAILLVEHNLDAAMRFATRAIVLDQEGRLVFDGPVAEVIREHTDDLMSMGVWLPAATLAALRLRASGIVLEPLPLTPEALGDGLMAHQDKVPALPPVAAPLSPHDSVPLIRARGLTVTRGRTEILYNVDLDIRPGTFTAILGTNGAGKTTLIQALAGVVPPPKKQVEVDGVDAGHASPRELAARIGFVFQSPEHQFITHTVFEELAHGLRLQRLPEEEITERAQEMLRRFGLVHKADVHPFLLSGGEKRRLSVGTALIMQPRVLALDEPTFGQDRSRAAELLDLLEQLRTEGTTIMVVTHDLQLVAEYASDIVILRDGHVHAAGETAALLAQEQVFLDAGLGLPALYRVLPPALRGLRRLHTGGQA